MHGDAAFVIGMTHKVCEDYAYARQDVGRYIACVSDGCSGSVHTDVGSRILALTWPQFGIPWSVRNLEAISDAVVDQCDYLGLPLQAADATLLGINCSSNSNDKGATVDIFGTGDGFMAIRSSSKLTILELEVASGYPFYVNYHASGGRTRLHGYLEDGNVMVCREHGEDDLICPDGLMSRKMFLQEGDVVAVFSDGVASCIRDGEVVDPLEVIRDLMDFKSMAGSFVQRRMHGFFRKVRKEGWRVEDDLSMAAIYVG